MKSISKQTHTLMGLVAFVCTSAWCATPAFADTPGGADILLPKPAEFIPALVAFLVIWFVMAKFAWPQIVSMMEKRELKIKGDLDSAEKLKVEAKQDREAAEQTLADAQVQAADIIASARRDAEAQRAHIISDAQAHAAGIMEKSRDAIAHERHKATLELSGFVVDLAVEIASKIIKDGMSVEAQRKLAERCLAEVGAQHGEEQS